MSRLDAGLLANLIGAAIEGKYRRVTKSHIASQVQATLVEIRNIEGEGNLIKCVRPANNFDDDVRNQIIAYTVIEEFWRYRFSGEMLQRLHSILYGEPSIIRTADFVSDFGGIVPTPVSAIADQLRRLNSRITEDVDRYDGRDLEEKALFLAQMFADIIRVHPFQDGNGRTARMVVQYCLRRWGRPYILIPKVRNVGAWKSALTKGISGDYDMLAAQISRRLRYTEAKS